jgi:ABC-2 type transport system permease protein
MSQIWAMTRKELRLWAQKPGAWIIVFVAPLIFIWIMNAVFGESGTPVVAIYAVNEDGSRASQQVMQELEESGSFDIETLETRSEADRLVGQGERMAAVIVPKGFSDLLSTADGARIDIIIDPARAEQANIVTGLLNSALGPFIIDAEVRRSVEASVGKVIDLADLRALPDIQPTSEIAPEEPTAIPQAEVTSEAPGIPYPEPTEDLAGIFTTPEPAAQKPPSPNETLRLFFSAAIKGVVSSQVQEALEDPQIRLVETAVVEPQTARRPSLLDYLVPGYSLMFMYYLIPNLAMTVIAERQNGTMRRLLSAPVSRSSILLGKMLPYFLIGVVQMITVLVAGRVIFGIDLGSSPVALGLLITASALAMAGLGVLVAALARTEGQANGLTIIIVQTMAVVSGAMFPRISIPGLQAITPHYWSLQGFLNLVARGQGFEGVMGPVGILLTMAALFFTIGAIRFRFE